jgi:type III pantothenate kinase
MLFVVDIGNTDICLSLFQGREILRIGRIRTHQPKAVEKCLKWVLKVVQAEDFPFSEIENTIISCVVPTLLTPFKEACVKVFSKEPLVLGEVSAPFPILSLIDQPGEEGTDLMANAYAAHMLYQGPLLVVDFGTATTLSLIDQQGNFCGTVIAPGVHLSLQALSLNAAKLPEVSIKKPKQIMGTNTVDSIQSGIFWGYVSMIEGLIHRIKKENFRNLLQGKFEIVATGGLSSLIVPSCSMITHVEPHLTLRGIAFIYESLFERK